MSDVVEGWFEDPTGRHDRRYWDGASWSDRVSDTGTLGVDALPGSRRTDSSAPSCSSRRPLGPGAELSWNRDGGNMWTGYHITVSDANGTCATLENGFWGLNTIVIDEREYRVRSGVRKQVLVNDAATGMLVARLRRATPSKQPRWSILVQDTPALRYVWILGRRGEPQRYEILDRAGAVAMTITHGKGPSRRAVIGALDLGESTVLVACLACQLTLISSGGGGG